MGSPPECYKKGLVYIVYKNMYLWCNIVSKDANYSTILQALSIHPNFLTGEGKPLSVYLTHGLQNI